MLSAELREDLRLLGRKHGVPTLLAGCAELLRSLSVKGASAELVERRSEAGAVDACPRCRARDQLREETLTVLARCAHEVPHGQLAAGVDG